MARSWLFDERGAVAALHHGSHDSCFLANSVRSEIIAAGAGHT